jgi:hypothetical protein
MLNKNKLIELMSDAIIAVFEQGLDEDEHFRTSLNNSYNKEDLATIGEEEINAALQLARSELKDLIFVMIDDLVNKD